MLDEVGPCDVSLRKKKKEIQTETIKVQISIGDKEALGPCSQLPNSVPPYGCPRSRLPTWLLKSLCILLNSCPFSSHSSNCQILILLPHIFKSPTSFHSIDTLTSPFQTAIISYRKLSNNFLLDFPQLWFSPAQMDCLRFIRNHIIFLKIQSVIGKILWRKYILFFWKPQVLRKRCQNMLNSSTDGCTIIPDQPCIELQLMLYSPVHQINIIKMVSRLNF